MGGRYVITGVQLAIIKAGLTRSESGEAINLEHALHELNNVEDKQYIGESNQGIEDDAQFLSELDLIRTL